jgi:hypothetical protein
MCNKSKKNKPNSLSTGEGLGEAKRVEVDRAICDKKPEFEL